MLKGDATLSMYCPQGCSCWLPALSTGHCGSTQGLHLPASRDQLGVAQRMMQGEAEKGNLVAIEDRPKANPDLSASTEPVPPAYWTIREWCV